MVYDGMMVSLDYNGKYHGKHHGKYHGQDYGNYEKWLIKSRNMIYQEL